MFRKLVPIVALPLLATAILLFTAGSSLADKKGSGSHSGHSGGHSSGYHGGYHGGGSGFYFAPGYGFGYYRGYYPGYPYYYPYQPYRYYSYPYYPYRSRYYYYDYGPEYSYNVYRVPRARYTPAPAAESIPEDAVLFDLRVPAEAEVWFEGQKTSQTGASRQFVTPALERGYAYTYEIRARWTENGKPVERTRKIKVHAGDRLGMNLTSAAPEEGTLPVPRRVQ